MLITLMRPTAGSATVASYDIARETAQVRQHIGYVPQLVSSDGALTGRENLLFSARLYHLPSSERRRTIDDALDFMGLSELADRLTKTSESDCASSWRRRRASIRASPNAGGSSLPGSGCIRAGQYPLAGNAKSGWPDQRIRAGRGDVGRRPWEHRVGQPITCT